MSSKLARSIRLSIRGELLNIHTPLLVPSFSSKASVDIAHAFDTLQPSITDTFLVSAYDIFHQKIQLPPNALAEVLFLDSGGYEVAKDYDPMDPLYQEPEHSLQIQESWNIEELP